MSGILPCLGIAGSLTVIFGFLAFLRYMNYRETVALAEKGLSRPDTRSRHGLLRWGMITTAFGFAISVGLYMLGFSAGYGYPLHLGPWMLGGFVPLFLGLALILSHFLSQKE